MNHDLFMNDTFDNLTFADPEALISPSRRLSNSGDTEIIINHCVSLKSVEPLINNSSIKKDSNRESLSPKDEISFDDSFFLEESLSLLQQCSLLERPKDVNLQQKGNVDVININRNNESLPSVSDEQSPNSVQQTPKNITERNSYNDNVSVENNSSIQMGTCEISLKSENRCDNVEITEESRKLSSWGLPDTVLGKYEARNIKHMFDWQVECLSNQEVLHNNKNLVYSAPTSAGKTLVAEILALKTLFEQNKKVLFILPFVSIVREKMYYFQDILASSGIRVDGFMGSHNPPGGFHSVQFAICTIEKANSLVNRLLEEGKLSQVGAVLVDEMHLLGDPSRGYLLELLLTKLKYITLKEENVQIQIIGMSATLPNLEGLAKWLDAELYTTSFRPVPLEEQVIESGNIYDKNLQPIRKLDIIPEIGKDTDNILQLCLETIRDSCSVLIFCPTKNWCESLAEQVAVAFLKIGNSNTTYGCLLREQIKAELIVEVLEQLKYCPVGLDDILRKTVAFGVAFHHAGLTMDERDIIEGAFRNGAIRILIATSTLSSGVNLPARRVIIRTPNFHGKPIDILTYRQMIGRAGRMGKDSMGESFLVCHKNDFNTAKELVTGSLHPVESCLQEGKLKRAILEIIASGVASSPSDVSLFTKCTLLAASDFENDNDIQNPIDDAISFLVNHEFIRLQQNEKYVATSLGKACLSSSMPPDEGLSLFSELDKARQCFVLETELHLIYLVTPYSACHSWSNIDWMLYLDLWEKLPVSMKRVGELVGIKQSYLVNAARGKIQSNTSKSYHQLLVHKRFFVALALQDLVNEKSLGEVCIKFNCNRGLLQSLQQSASSFAGMVTSFSRELGWYNVEILLSQFQDRMQFGVSRDLLDLMRLPLLNGKMARILYNAGIDSLVQLANSNAQTVEQIFHKSVPFESSKERDGESEYAQQQRNKFRRFWITGKDGLNEKEAAEMLVSNARNYLKLEMGLAEAKWDSSVNNCSIVNSDSKNDTDTTKGDDGLTKQVESLNINNSVITSADSEHTNRILENETKSSAHNIEQILSTSSSELSISSNSIFSSISFTKIEESSSNKSDTTPLTNVSNSCVSKESSNNVEKNSNQSLNEILSNNSLFSDNSSLTSESFNLQLSDNTDNIKTSNKSDSDQSMFDSGTFLEKAFNSSFEIEDEKVVNNEADEVLASSLTEEQTFITPSLARKRSRRSKVRQNSLTPEATPSKKKRLMIKSECSSSNSSDKSSIEIKTGSASVDFSKINIINVCNDINLLESFESEIKNQKCIALSVACSKVDENRPMIGANILQTRSKTLNLAEYTYEGQKIDGLAIVCSDLNSYYLSLENPNLNSTVLNIINNLLMDSSVTVKIFSSKEQIKILMNCCNVQTAAKIEDPKIADWLLDPESKEKNLQNMTSAYCPQVAGLVKLAGNCKGVGSVGANLTSSINSKIRASVEAIVTWQLTESLKNILSQRDHQLISVFEVEMETIKCLANMEVTGIGVSKVSMQKLIDLLKNLLDAIEKKAFSLAGRRFNFMSSRDVAKAIGVYQGKKISTKKQVLEQSEHPISDLVLQWRKVSCTLSKMIYPIIREIKNDRIHGCYVTHTSTGRITMHEPNLQNITKDFIVKNPLTKEDLHISCRSTFCPTNGYVLVSADYCQLELRILSHLADEKLLKNIMRKPGDVFKSIAAKWNNIDENKVTDEIRQNTKHICYGIIYGMGEKSLAEQLGKPEEDVIVFMETFRNTYPGIKKFIKDTIKFCSENGYVKTIMGRKRFLPHIRDSNPVIKAQAERQAVNTCVQGTAADISKKAMISIEAKIRDVFRKSTQKPRITLHLHDELICETPMKYSNKVALIMRKCMENAVKLSVPLPVKVKTGKSWGELTECEA